MITLYGIANCDTVKKARAWLADHGVDYTFIDFKKTPPSRTQIAGWCKHFGHETVVNRRGTTWRKLSAQEQAKAASPQGAIEVLEANVSAIKRPILDAGACLLIGFDTHEYAKALAI